jgi:hypothetical protein
MSWCFQEKRIGTYLCDKKGKVEAGKGLGYSLNSPSNMQWVWRTKTNREEDRL